MLRKALERKNPTNKQTLFDVLEIKDSCQAIAFGANTGIHMKYTILTRMQFRLACV